MNATMCAIIFVCYLGEAYSLCPMNYRWRGWGPQWEQDLEDWAKCAEDYAAEKLQQAAADLKEGIIVFANKSEEITIDIFNKTENTIEKAIDVPLKFIEKEFNVKPNSTADEIFQDAKHVISLALAVIVIIAIFAIVVLLVAMCIFYKKTNKIWAFIKEAKGDGKANNVAEIV